MSHSDAQNLLQTLDDGWKLQTREPTEKRSKHDDEGETPISLYKEFNHSDFLKGAKFISNIAAVAHNNNHYPLITLERKLFKNDGNVWWGVVSTIHCRTEVLGGLSYHDFHVAMLIDIEIARDSIASLIEKKNDKKDRNLR